MRLLPNAHDEHGFTIIEVMVAALILAIGVLATFTMFDSANALTIDNRAREGAINLSRELIDDARTATYDNLTSSGAQSELQALPNLGDAKPAQTGWQIVRRGITFTVTAKGCTFDSGKDGARTVSADDGSFCKNSVTAGTNPVDGNPDDFRRVEVTVTWSRPGKTPNCQGADQTNTSRNSVCVLQSTLIANPAGGLGPAIDSTSFNPSSGTVFENVGASGITVAFNTRSAADTVNWQADDSVSTGTASTTDSPSTYKKWALNWGGASPSPSLPALDGNYTLAIQAFLLSVPGDVTPYVISLNRFTPFAPTLPASSQGGVDSRIVNAGQGSQYIVDLNWKANSERDIVGYAVFRTNSGSPSLNSSIDTVVCDTRSPAVTSCFDPSPPASGSVNYYVVAFDQPWTTNHGASNNPPITTCSGVSNVDTIAVANAVKAFDPQFNGGATARAGCPSAMIPVDITAGLANSPPSDPTGGAGGLSSGGLPHLSWTASTDSDGILYYRIYRDPATTSPIPYSARYDRTTSGSATTYDDPQPGATTAHTYYVTAVDSNYQESQPLRIDTP